MTNVALWLAAFGALGLVATAPHQERNDPTNSDNEVLEELVEVAANQPNGIGDGAVYCGGETTRQVIDAYFAELRQGLIEGREATFFNRFVADRFSSYRNNRYLAFDREDFVSVTPRFFSLQDWREIAARGPEALESGGYRGCMYDHGKIWFSGDGDRFELHAINHDLPWVEPN